MWRMCVWLFDHPMGQCKSKSTWFGFMVTIKPPSVLDIKIILRRLFDNPNTLFRIIVYIPQSNKVKPLTSLYKLMANDDIEEVVSTDTTSVWDSFFINCEWLTWPATI